MHPLVVKMSSCCSDADAAVPNTVDNVQCGGIKADFRPSSLRRQTFKVFVDEIQD